MKTAYLAPEFVSVDIGQIARIKRLRWFDGRNFSR